MRFIIMMILILLIGCSNEQVSNENISDIPTDSNASDQQEQEVVIEKKNFTFKEFNLPTDFTLIRELSDADSDASYKLYEYEVSSSLDDINKWLRNEASRLGGKVIERFSYNIESNANLDLIIELPSDVGTRIISTYSPKYIEKQHLVIEETLFQQPMIIDQNYEDHALVVFTPLTDGSTKETFKGNYFHQHTDIYSIYFYSQAFFEELIEVNKYNLSINYDVRTGDTDYIVGYVDKDLNEVYSIDLTEEHKDRFKFGIHLKYDFLPKDESKREELLFHWAKTVLLGDKASSLALDGNLQIQFFMNGEVIQSYTVNELTEK